MRKLARAAGDTSEVRVPSAISDARGAAAGSSARALGGGGPRPFAALLGARGGGVAHDHGARSEKRMGLGTRRGAAHSETAGTDELASTGPTAGRTRRGAHEAIVPEAPLGPALAHPPAPRAGVADGSTSAGGLARAEAVALAERLVTSLRVGRVRGRAHEIRLSLALSASSELAVRLSVADGTLCATLEAPWHARGELERIGAALARELAERGVTLGTLELTTG